MPKQTKAEQQVALLAKQLAELQQQFAELKQKPASTKRQKGQPRPDVYYVLAGIPTHDLPPQAIACAKILSTATDVNRIPEQEAFDLFVAAKEAGKLRTIQEAWHIFQYYRPRLIEKDFLKMLTVA